MFIYIIISIIVIYILINIYIYLLKVKIERFEKQILNNFKEKNNKIASIYEVTKGHISKHNEVFDEAKKLKRKDFSENTFNINLIGKYRTNRLIHKELDFIFRVCNKNPKLNNNHKYLYIRDSIVNISENIWEDLSLYKKIIKKYNNIIFLNKITILWLLLPFNKKESMH